MAYQLVGLLKVQNHHIVLDQLKKAVSHSETKANKLHKVFGPSFDWKECGGEKLMEQKLQYIHVNPCKAGIVKQPELYLHSSARYYIAGEHSGYEVLSFMALAGIGLTNGKRKPQRPCYAQGLE